MIQVLVVVALVGIAAADLCDFDLEIALLVPLEGSAEACLHGYQTRHVVEQVISSYDTSLQNAGVNVSLVTYNTPDEVAVMDHMTMDLSENTAVVLGPYLADEVHVAQLYAGPHNMPHVSPMTSSSELHSQGTLLSTYPSTAYQAEAIVAFIEEMNWSYLSILASKSSNTGLVATEDIETAIQGHGPRGKESDIEVKVSRSFYDDESDESLIQHLEEIHHGDSRLVLLACSATSAARIMKLAEEENMVGKGWVWIGTEWATPFVWQALESEYDNAEYQTKLKEAMTGLISVTLEPSIDQEEHFAESFYGAGYETESCFITNDAGDIDVATSTVLEFSKLDENPVSPFLGAVHDSAEMIVGAITYYFSEYTTGVGQTLCNSNEDFTEKLLDYMLTYDLPEGLTGELTFGTGDALGERQTGVYHVLNWKLEEEDLVPVVIAEYDIADFSYTTIEDVEIMWPGESKAVPSDRYIHSAQFLAMFLLCTFAFLITTFVIGDYIETHNIHYFPESGATVFLGAAVGAVIRLVNVDSVTSAAEFDTRFFTLVLLPVIIFEAGFSLVKHTFFKNIGTILLLALGGTTICTMYTGFGLKLLADNGFLPNTQFSTAEFLAFGALISAVDPVATIVTFGALGADKNLVVLVFGESVINDAVAIVMFHAFCDFITEEVTAGAIAFAFGKFLLVCIGSMVIGIAVALATAYVLKKCHLHSDVFEICVLALSSYLAFECAEAPHLSGIVASLSCGIAMQHYAYRNLTEDAKKYTRKLIKVLAVLAETLIFFMVGVNIFTLSEFPDWRFTLWTILLCLTGRALNTFPLSAIANLKRFPKIPFNHQVMLWHAGLRGAIAYALAVGFPSHNKTQIVGCTIGVVLYTTFVNGGTTLTMLKFLKIKMGDEDLHHEEEKEKKNKMENIPDELSGYLPEHAKEKKKLFPKISEFDQKYVKPALLTEKAMKSKEERQREEEEQNEQEHEMSDFQIPHDPDEEEGDQNHHSNPLQGSDHSLDFTEQTNSPNTAMREISTLGDTKLNRSGGTGIDEEELN